MHLDSYANIQKFQESFVQISLKFPRKISLFRIFGRKSEKMLIFDQKFSKLAIIWEYDVIEFGFWGPVLGPVEVIWVFCSFSGPLWTA